ncbi:DUF6788 family protein [Pengzhenrongella sp.]|uniref:DUF6788 family protein n=1 Tax=Pengzhenrongella sp. TaxID=2888820 RepID=UPI0039C9FA6F
MTHGYPSRPPATPFSGSSSSSLSSRPPSHTGPPSASLPAGRKPPATTHRHARVQVSPSRVAPGSVIERYTLCATPTCRCHSDPQAPHGPYFQYTRKLAGKTLTRRLNGDEAERYREWIRNCRRLDTRPDGPDLTPRGRPHPQPNLPGLTTHPASPNHQTPTLSQ